MTEKATDKKTPKKKKPLLTTTFFVVLFCVGFFGMVAYHSQLSDDPQKSAKDNLIEEIEALEEENSALEASIAALQKKLESISLYHSFDTETTADLEAANKALKEAAGGTEVTTSGILVELDDNAADAQKAQAKDGAAYHAEDFIVHDKNLLYLINAMRGYASEISVNDQRIVTNSTIRCVGSVIMVNQSRVAPPYHIQFGGDSTALMKAIKSCDYYDELLATPLILNITEESSLIFPAYAGTLPTDTITVIETEAQ